MSELLQKVIKEIERLPPGEQDAAAGALIDDMAHRDDVRLSDAQFAEVRRRRADPAPRMVSHAEARERIGRLGR
ncbi:hypothetical protein [Rhodoplanes roseus]|uniref:Uncharacterized protein n=1 Tax=Rhodoplanes roseus TaxID=29409 RepID=A0A327KYJ1_9BRAD|nr:hypothetical protein [Rhodoplanes roseus]RAI43146.1 hypothetical protein CH341_15910 [Rhodoplanes roseus]